MMRPTRANKPDGYLLGSYRIATAPEPNSSRLTSFKSRRFDSPANNVGPWPTSLTFALFGQQSKDRSAWLAWECGFVLTRALGYG